MKLLKHLSGNPNLFPNRSSDKYIHDVSEGVILDNKPIDASGNHPIAIRTGALKKLFEIDSDNKYRAVLDSLMKIGVLQGELRFYEMEGEESEVTLDNYGKAVIKTTNTTRKAVRLDERVTMNKKGQYASVYIFNNDLERGE